MAPRKRKKSAPCSDALPPQLATVNLHAAGIDVGAEEHWAAVPACDDSHPVRRFGANTADLDALADWLWACGITTVALESTGVYWIPLFEVLEARGFQVLLVDPGKMPRNGRPKSDVHDCQWLQRLHTYGLLSACFRPEDQVVVLRSYLRQRAALLADAARDIQHMQKALTQMNVKLQHVVSDITGVTGLAIIKAILAGRTRPAAVGASYGIIGASRTRPPSPRRCMATGGKSTCLPYSKRWSATSSSIGRLPPVMAGLQPSCRRSRTVARASRYPPSRASGGATATGQPSIRGSRCIA